MNSAAVSWRAVFDAPIWPKPPRIKTRPGRYSVPDGFVAGLQVDNIKKMQLLHCFDDVIDVCDLKFFDDS